MEQPDGNTLRISESEKARANFSSSMAERALEILGNRQELKAWLEAATRATELPWAFSASG